MSFINEKLVGENSKCKFYKNFLCQEYKGYNILLVELKSTKKRTYIVVKDGKPVAENNKIEGLYCNIDILKLMEKNNKKCKEHFNV